MSLGTHMLRTALLLGLFGIIGSGLVAYVFDVTEEPIAVSERQAILRSLHQIVPPTMHDNDLFNDVVNLPGSELRAFRARQDDKPVAVVIETLAPEGYGGTIFLLVGIRYDGTILGVRVVRHRETPGLGDAVEIERSDWVTGFNNKSLSNPGNNGWRVKKDGGDFDQFTGATITPRAVVKAVHAALELFAEHRDALFAPINEEGQ